MCATPVHRHDDRSFLLVRSGGQRCAVPITAVLQVAEALAVRPLPGSAPRLLGLAQFSGEPLAVVDLHALLGPDGEPGGGHELTLVVRRPSGDIALGLAIDEAFGVVELTVRDEPEEGDPPWVTGRSFVGDRSVIVVDPSRLFDTGHDS